MTKLKRNTSPVQSWLKCCLWNWLHGSSFSFQFNPHYPWCNAMCERYIMLMPNCHGIRHMHAWQGFRQVVAKASLLGVSCDSDQLFKKFFWQLCGTIIRLLCHTLLKKYRKVLHEVHCTVLMWIIYINELGKRVPELSGLRSLFKYFILY